MELLERLASNELQESLNSVILGYGDEYRGNENDYELLKQVVLVSPALLLVSLVVTEIIHQGRDEDVIEQDDH